MDARDRQTLECLIKQRDQLARRHAMQERLMAFERELTSSNRFFPRTDILGWVDSIAPMVRRAIPAGVTLYRGRIVPKAEEGRFLAPVYHHALGVFVQDEKGDLDHTRLTEAYVRQEIERLEAGSAPRDLAAFRDQLGPCMAQGWWGYDRRESDAAPSDATGNGRINPVGISYLYASSRPETAALETRPVISQMVSVAEVVTCEELALFDLTRNVFDEDGQPDEDARMFRKLLAHYFSKPNYSGDRAYLVTQYISEYVKGSIEASTGLAFDGICFSSSLDRAGTNYVIFDTTKRPKYRIVASSLQKVTDMGGTLQTYLPMGDATIRALMEGTF